MVVNNEVPIADVTWLNNRQELSYHLGQVLEKQARQALLAIVIRVFDGWLILDRTEDTRKYVRRVMWYHKYIDAKLRTIEPRRYSLESVLSEHKARNERFIEHIRGLK